MDLDILNYLLKLCLLSNKGDFFSHLVSLENDCGGSMLVYCLNGVSLTVTNVLLDLFLHA